jgi:hypothetical protein
VLPRFELWFIWALSLFFVVAKATRRVPPRWQLAVAGLVSAASLTVWADTTTGWTGSAKFYFFFLVGIHGRQLLLAAARGCRPATGAAVMLLWAVVSVGLFLLDLRGAPGLYFLDCLLGVAAGIVVSIVLSRIQWLSRIGQQTLPIYLAHTPLILAMAFLVSRPGVTGVLQHIEWVVPPVVAALAVAGSLALYRLLRRIGATWVYDPPAAVGRRLLGCTD